MREILFRGKRIDNGTWVEGWMRPWLSGSVQISDASFLCMHHVDPNTVGQYTGLTDKNGKRIFEGDIVQMRTDGLSGRGAIVFKDGAFGVDDKKRRRFYYMYNDAVYRVDGNIHDNPELLELGGKENGRSQAD